MSCTTSAAPSFERILAFQQELNIINNFLNNEHTFHTMAINNEQGTHIIFN